MSGNKVSTILVTGAGGVLGSTLADSLSEAGVQVYALSSNREKLKGLDKNIICFENCDIDKIPWGNMDTVIHSAFTRSNDGYELARSLDFTREVFYKACKNGVKSIINISSRSVYGQNPAVPWKETDAAAPDSTYSLAKYSSELLAEDINTLSGGGTRAISLRLAGLIGIGYGQRVVNQFVINVLNSKPIRIFGGNQMFSFLDVRDAALGIKALLQLDTLSRRRLYNLGSRKCISIIDIAEAVSRVAGCYTKNQVKIEIEEKNITSNGYMDSSLFYSDTKWMPRYKITDTIEQLFMYNQSIMQI